MTPEQLREALADYAHETWSGWMRYMFGRSQPNEDGTITLAAVDVGRWTRQLNTPYADLPDNEKGSDRVEADKMLAIIANAFQTANTQIDEAEANLYALCDLLEVKE